MAELFEAVASWQTLLLVLLVFGFAPGFVLRLLVLAYPRSDPRRRELIAELYAMPRIQRPLWVAEQLEVALFEGLAHRVSATIRSFTQQRRAWAQTRKYGPVFVLMFGTVLNVVIVAKAEVGAFASTLASGVAWYGVMFSFTFVLLQIVLLRAKRTERRWFSPRKRSL